MIDGSLKYDWKYNDLFSLSCIHVCVMILIEQPVHCRMNGCINFTIHFHVNEKYEIKVFVKMLVYTSCKLNSMNKRRDQES